MSKVVREGEPKLHSGIAFLYMEIIKQLWSIFSGRMEVSMKKGTFMNEKEWLDYFETINNRKPTEEEIQQAKESNNEGANLQQAQLSDQVTQAVSQVAPAETGLSKKAKIIIASVVGAIVLVVLSFGGYAFMHLQSGKIPEGTYLLETYRFYHKDKKKMVDGMESFKESGLEAHDFVKVKGNNVKFYFYTLAGGNNLVDFTDYDTDEAYRPDTWSRTLKPNMSLSEYSKVIDQAVDNQYKISEYRTQADNDESKKIYVKSYKESLEETVRYKVKGNKLIVTTYNKKGKLTEERSFKRLSEDDVKKLDYDASKTSNV